MIQSCLNITLGVFARCCVEVFGNLCCWAANTSSVTVIPAATSSFGCGNLFTSCFIYHKFYQCCSYISTQVSKCCAWTSNKVNDCNNFICQTCIEITDNDNSHNPNIIDPGANNNPVGIIINPVGSIPITNNPNVNLMGSLPTNSEQANHNEW